MKLPVNQRPNALAYNLANLYFSNNAYKDAIKQLQKVDLDDVSTGLTHVPSYLNPITNWTIQMPFTIMPQHSVHC